MSDIECIVTMGTAECLAELGLMLASVRAFHEHLPVVVGTTSDALHRLAAGDVDSAVAHSRLADECVTPGAKAAVEYLAAAVRSDAQLTVLPCLDQYGAVSRKRMERQPGVWFPTRHCDFMMEKANLLDWALQRGHKGALFADCDMVFTAPLAAVPEHAVIGLSDHGIRAVDARLFGRYNGGWVYVRDSAALFEWRRATHASRYFDQASLEALAERYSGACHLFGPGTNFGYWRMFQADASPAEVARRFAVNDGGVRFDGEPLQSVHTHFFMPSDSRTTPVFNRLVATWTARAGIATRVPRWSAVGAMLSGFVR